MVTIEMCNEQYAYVRNT